MPFCTGKCPYCGFYSGIEPLPGITEAFSGALLAEIGAHLPAGAAVGTVYAGGGTPGLLPVPRWREIMGAIARRCIVEPGAEATIEVNPGSCSFEVFEGLRGIGFNRVSMGIQSFEAVSLEALGRRHSRDDSLRAVETARTAGFGSISVDLIYGIPGQDAESWRRDILAVLGLGPDHISCYSLGFEKGTPLAAALEAGRVAKPADGLLADMYILADSILTNAGYEHYEVSNYALGTGNRSRHNEGYWNGSPYFGLGPSAHGYDGASRRWWNVSDLDSYTSLLEAGKSPEAGFEVLTREQWRLERLMLGLRTSTGIRLSGISPAAERLVARWAGEGLCSWNGEELKPTSRGMFLADGMAADISLLLDAE